MILNALSRYDAGAGREAIPLGYAEKPLGFTLVLRPDGLGCRIQPNYDDDRRAPARIVPNLARTVAPLPFLGCDAAAYVLGLGKPTERAEKTAIKHALFAQQIRDFAAEASTPVTTAYLSWVDAGRPGLMEAVESLDGAMRTRLDMDMVAVAITGAPGLMHEGRAAEEFWGQLVRTAKAGGPEAMCLVCGTTAPTVSTLPQSLIGHLVPGATQANVALASVNFPAASRGASGLGLRSAPICADCAAKAVQNFNALAASEKNSWRAPGGHVGLMWWTTNPDFDEFAVNTITPDARWVAELLDAPKAGHEEVRAPLEDGDFFALTYSGNVARFVMRRFVHLPVGEIKGHVLEWFKDVESPSRSHRFFPLARYAASLGPMRREQGKWVTPPPEGALEALMMVALAGDRIPPHLLALALGRAVAELPLTGSDDPLTAGLSRRRMEARVGVLRLILNRNTLKEHPMKAQLDEERSDPAFLSGRLFALAEGLQKAAVPNLNASIVDKYFQKALTSPASMVGTLETLSKQHLKALERSGHQAWGRYDREIRRLNAARGDAPGRLSDVQQAAWICGYHQQRMHDIETAIARSEAKRAAQATELIPDPTEDTD